MILTHERGIKINNKNINRILMAEIIQEPQLNSWDQTYFFKKETEQIDLKSILFKHFFL